AGGEELHPGAAPPAPVEVGGQAGRAAAGGGEQPPAAAAGQEQEAATAAERGGRADVRARLRHGRGATELAPRVGRREQAVPDGGGGAQPGPAHAPAERDRQTKEFARRRRPGRAGAASHGPANIHREASIRNDRVVGRLVAPARQNSTQLARHLNSGGGT